MRITVIGGGNGAFATAAHMVTKGHQVTLCHRNTEKLKLLNDDPSLKISGGGLPDQTVSIHMIVEDPAQAIQGAEIIIISLPIHGHSYYAKRIADTLTDNQTILLNPGHMGGALCFAKILRESGYSGKLNIFETHTLTYICRLVDDHLIDIFKIAKNVLIASIPAINRNLKKIIAIYPDLIPVPTVMHTSLSDHNAVLHPPGMLLNAARIETQVGGNFTFYNEGTTPAVAKLIAALDKERLTVARALDISLESFLQSFYKQGYTTEEAYNLNSIYTALKQSEPNKKIMAETTLMGRYIHEDIGYGLVPISLLGKCLGVPCPVMDGFINICCCINETNYWETGMTLEKMGIEGVKSKEELWNTIARL